MRSVRIEWEGPFSLAKVLGLDNENKGLRIIPDLGSSYRPMGRISPTLH